MSPDAAGPDAAGSDVTGPVAVLDPRAVRALLSTEFWVRIEGGGATGSTNDDARELACAGAPEGTVVLATAQHQGRGRFGRTWASPAGGLYLSVVLRPLLNPGVRPDALSALPLVVALGVAHGLERLGASPRIKWPNDVMLGQRKVAGVLVESRMGAPDSGWAVAGIGINVTRPVAGPAASDVTGADAIAREAVISGAAGARSPAGRVPPDAAFLDDTVAQVGVAECAAAVLDEVAHAYQAFVSGGFGALAAEYRSYCATLGQEVVASGRSGAVLAEGKVVEVDAAGRLLVETAEGRVAVTSADVSLRGPS